MLQVILQVQDLFEGAVEWPSEYKELRFEHRNHWQSLWAHLTWKHGYPYATQLIHFVAVYPWIPLSLDPYRYLL